MKIQIYKKARNWIVVGLLVVGGLHTSAQNYTMSNNSSWGNSGFVNDYYHGQQSAFQVDRSIFNYGNSAFQNMGSTSAYAYNPGDISTAAASIIAGVTIADYEEQEILRAMSRRAPGQGGGTPGVPDWEITPIGDGWDVLLFLLLLAGGYGLYLFKRKPTLK